MRRLWIVCALVLLPTVAGAQYFGRNKVQYRTFDFQVLKTDHFDLYYYPEERDAADITARMAERWHARLSRFFGHDLRGRQPVILYAVSAHFRQTNAIDSLIGEGTGGVTEALKRRIVLPVSGSLADTDHVLGHELVHAFQFDLTGADPRDREAQAPGILAFPLWFVEGMAEYLSVGPVDGQTAMWLRDAARREKLPSIKDLDDPKYFPYRWGHAFWAYVGARYGDRAVASLIRSAANPRYDMIGLARQLGSTPDALTEGWHQAIVAMTEAVTSELSPIVSQPTLAVGRKTGGQFNIGPEVSPDGRQIAFFSERDRFSVELFLADAESGRIERKLLKSSTDPHFDSLEFLNSAGAWSPDGRRLALTAIRGGRPVLALIDPQSGRIQKEVRLPGLDDALNPSFAPDGASVVLAGNVGGLVDLYRCIIATGALERLTHDAFADLEPVFTPDGKTVVFVTERFSSDLATLRIGPLRLATLDLATKTVRPLTAFLGGKQLSPHVSADGRTVTFVADPDGVSNIYRMPIDGGPVDQLSSVVTGVAGITASSPALSMATTGRLVFSLFEEDGHAIYVLDPNRTVALVPPAATRADAVLPGRSIASLATSDVQGLLNDFSRGLPVTTDITTTEPYRRGLSLDELGQPSIGAGVSAGGGARVSGAMSAFFSDMLGDRSLGVSGQIGGGLADVGGEFLYLSRRHRWNWAASIFARPNAVETLTRTDAPDGRSTTIEQRIDRQPQRGVSMSAAFPFNLSRRIELSTVAQRLSQSTDTRRGTYEGLSRVGDVVTEHRELSAPLYLAQASVAFVSDTSYFGATSPLYGSRLRLEVGQTSGSLNFQTVLADWRRYVMPVSPLTFGVRALYSGRYGRQAGDERIVPFYLGYPEFVHGYGNGSFSEVECLSSGALSPGSSAACAAFGSIIGSRMLVLNAEVRAPLKGLFTGKLEYGRVPIDVVAFFDAGVAWTQASRPAFLNGDRPFVRSAGGAVRLNVIGLFALEVSAAHPLDRVDRRVQWQVGIRQGF